MKYTRYDLGRNKNKKNAAVILIVVLILICSYIIGTAIFNFFIKNAKATSSNKNDISVDNKTIRYVFLQCGLFKDKENAKSMAASLSKYGNVFIMEDSGNNRVFMGIYNENEAGQIMKKLIESGIDNNKLAFQITTDNLCNLEFSKLLDANIQILNKFSDSNIKAIQTSNLKKWTSSLKDPDSSSKNFSQFKSLKKYILNLPGQINHDKVIENYEFLYKLFKDID